MQAISKKRHEHLHNALLQMEGLLAGNGHDRGRLQPLLPPASPLLPPGVPLVAAGKGNEICNTQFIVVQIN